MFSQEAGQIVSDTISHLPEDAKEHIICIFPHSKLRLRLTDGMSEQEARLYAATLFNEYFISDGFLDIRYSINIRNLKVALNL